MARKFFYVAAGMFLIALSFHFGFTTATAQVGSNVTGVATALNQDVWFLVMTPNGDIYSRCMSPGSGLCANVVPLGNFWSGAPTPTQKATWGQVKARYAPSPGTPTSETNDR